jgi:shikimate kinase
MGTGKSVVARALGRLTGYKVLDLDHEVESGAGMVISEIFASRGEAAFRDMETAALKRIASGRGQVISTGGGVVLRKENMGLLREGGGVIVNLTAPPETVFERTKATGHRPLLDVEDPLGRIRELMEERKPYYEDADEVVDTEGKSPMETAGEILERIGWKR